MKLVSELGKVRVTIFKADEELDAVEKFMKDGEKDLSQKIFFSHAQKIFEMSKKKFLKNAVAKNQCSKFLQSKKIYRKIFEVEKNNRRKNFSADAKQWTRRKKFAICAKRNFTNAAKLKNIIQFRQKKIL